MEQIDEHTDENRQDTPTSTTDRSIKPFVSPTTTSCNVTSSSSPSSSSLSSSSSSTLPIQNASKDSNAIKPATTLDTYTNNQSVSGSTPIGHVVPNTQSRDQPRDINTNTTKTTATPGLSTKLMDNNLVGQSRDGHVTGDGFTTRPSPATSAASSSSSPTIPTFPSSSSSLSSSTTSSSSSPLLSSTRIGINKRVPHLHKLEKKHSSGDLHSRLKTRKILGVGETDDGGVHRSKLSQILGHSDQLYVRLPYGLRAWQVTLALLYAGLGLWAIVHPGHLFNVALQTNASHDYINLSVRLYGGALISLSILHWATLNSQDRDSIRVTLLSSLVFFIVQFIASSWYFLSSSLYGGGGGRGTATSSDSPEVIVTWVESSILRLLYTSCVGGIVNVYFLWHLTYRRTYGKKMDDCR